MAPVPPGEPRVSPKPQPMAGTLPMMFLFTTCTLCALFLIWRRAGSLRAAISHHLKTFKRSEGRIRLSQDNGPPAREFLEDDYDEDNEHLEILYDRNGSEPLTEEFVGRSDTPGIPPLNHWDTSSS